MLTVCAGRHRHDPTGRHHGGTPTYPYRLAPAGLLTRRQLRARGLRPGGTDPVAQIEWRRGRRVAYLYRADLARPVRPMTPARWAAHERMMLPGLPEGCRVRHSSLAGHLLALRRERPVT